MNLDDFIVSSLEPGPPDPEVDALVAAGGEAAALAPELALQRQMLGDARTWEDPPAGLVDDLVAAIASERDGEATPAVVADAGGAGEVTPLDAARRRRRPSPWWSALPAAAAAVVVAVLVVGSDGGDGVVAGEPVQVELAGTELAPDARATAELAEWRSGVRVDLDVEGLPPAAPGFYYQAWVLGPSGPVAIGTFHLHDVEAVVLWSGVDARPGVVLSITREPDDGDPEPSGQRVLAGTVEQVPGE